MDLESGFNLPGSFGGKGGISVWQAQVALRMCKYTWLDTRDRSTFDSLFYKEICVKKLDVLRVLYQRWKAIFVLSSAYVSFSAFLRKVYGILLAQLLLTVAVCGVYMYVPSVRDYAQQR